MIDEPEELEKNIPTLSDVIAEINQPQKAGKK